MVAYRKVKTLLEFEGQVTVIAPQIEQAIQDISSVKCMHKEFQKSDLNGMELVVAATNDKNLNHEIAAVCKERGIPVNAVDQIEDCSFIFPSYVKRGEVVSAFSSGGTSPVITQYLKQQISPVMTEHLGQMAELLGKLREEVKACVDTEAKRKEVYQKILQLGLEQERLPEQEEIAHIVNQYKG